MIATSYTIHTTDSAPGESASLLRALGATVGVIPNLAAGMADSPQLLEAFLHLRQRYPDTGFSPVEIQALSLVAAVENNSAWPVAFHTAMALKEGMTREAVDRLRHGQEPDEPRLAALTGFARRMVRTRGAVGADAIDAFLHAGFTRQQSLHVVFGMAFSLLANYASHLIDPPLDPFLQPFAWSGR
jgi:alkylhydroperoxidase family enzyme